MLKINGPKVRPVNDTHRREAMMNFKKATLFLLDDITMIAQFPRWILVFKTELIAIAEGEVPMMSLLIEKLMRQAERELRTRLTIISRGWRTL